MKVFLWVLIALLVLTCLAKLIALAKGSLPERTRAGEATDVFLNAGLLIWAAILLVGIGA